MLDLDIQIKLQGTLIARVNNAAKAGIRDVMDDVVLPAAQEMSPRGATEREGEVHNADSLSTMTRQRGSKIYAYIRSNSGHGGYLEKGTAKMAATPYMQPAFEQSIPALEGCLRTRIDQLGELDQLIEDGGIQGLQSAVSEKKFRAPRHARKSGKSGSKKK